MLPVRLAWLSLVVAACACSACGDDGNSGADAAIDGPPDPCAPAMTFTGEYLAWDSGGAGFMGIPGATFTHRADPAATDATAPNGRFEMCIPAADGFVDITPAGGSDIIAGTVVINKNVVSLQPVQSYRSFTTTRAADFGFSSTQAHVFVHVHGAARTVMTTANASVQKTFDGTNWVDGNAGTDIYLGNVDPQGTTMLTITGGSAIGGGTIPLTEGKFTYVTVIAR